MRVILLYFVCFFVAAGALGQSVAGNGSDARPAAGGTDAGKTAASYADEPYVVERLDHVYTMAADGTGTTRMTVVARVQAEATVRQLGVVTIPFAGASEHVEIAYVRVRRPDGSVTATPVDEAIEMPSPVTTAAPFYSDLKQMQIPVRNLQVGDRLEWEATLVRTKAEAPGQFWGGESFLEEAVVLSQKVELRVPKDSPVRVWSGSRKAVESSTDKEKVYVWENAQLKPTVGKEAEAEKERKKKEVFTAEQEQEFHEGKFQDVAWSTFSSWEAVGKWYHDLEVERVVPDDEVKAKVAELTAGKTTQEEKVKAVYSYVSTQIRYIGVAFGIGRYQPHRAVEVLQNQYGDCKDKHTLLASMLMVLGLHPDAVLIGAGVRFNEALPSPAAFNHLITRFDMNGKEVWLDSTAEVAPYRVLNFVIRDKNALVIPVMGVAKIEKSPAELPFPARQEMQAVGALDKSGTANSHVTLTVRGDDELVVRGAFQQMSAAQYGDLVQRMSQGMGFGGTTSGVEVSRPGDTAEPLKVTYDYKREKPGNDWDNLRITTFVAPTLLPRVEEEDPPVQALWLGPARVEHSSSELKLPEGWGAVLPEAIHARSAWAKYDQTYRFDKGVLFAERTVEVLEKQVPVADWKGWKKFQDAAGLSGEPYVQLVPKKEEHSLTSDEQGKPVIRKPQAAPEVEDHATVSEAEIMPSGAKKGEHSQVIQLKGELVPEPGGKPGFTGMVDPGNSATGPSTMAANEEAGKLVANAYAAVQRHDLDEARRQLDDAKALNGEQAWLWTTYGYLELATYQLPAAIEDFQKELTLHPEVYAAYAPLAQAQRMLNRRQEAEKTLQKWAEAQPDSAAPAVALLSMLLAEEDFQGAATAAEASLAKLPEKARQDETLQMLLGRAQMKAGEKDKAHATLVTILKTTEDAGRMNDCAYELADAGFELPLAEAKTREALAKQTEESKGWTLDEDPRTLRMKTHSLAATWDTMGWILFKEGKVDEARSYVHAAMLTQLTAEVLEHLGEIEAARGFPDIARRDYELALATYPGYDMMGVRHTPGAKEKELLERVERLTKRGTKATDRDAKKELMALRSVPLGAAGALNGTEEFRLLLSGGRVMRAEKIGDKEVAGGEDKVKQASVARFWPEGSDASLVRQGFLNCHTGICELVLEP